MDNAIMDNATLNIHGQVFVWTRIFSSLAYIPKSGITGVYGDSIFKLSGGTARLLFTELYHFAFPPTVHEGPSFPLSSPTLVHFLSFFPF